MVTKYGFSHYERSGLQDQTSASTSLSPPASSASASMSFGSRFMTAETPAASAETARPTTADLITSFDSPKLTTARFTATYVEQHSLCEVCQKEGRLAATEGVHHKVPLSEGGTHARDNLIALCKSCHARIHAERGDRWHNS